jgi:hypothetical protein
MCDRIRRIVRRVVGRRETSLQLAAAALHEVGTGPETVQELLDAFRADYVAAYQPRERPAAGESTTPR